MAVIDLEKCVTYGKLRGVQERKGSTSSQTYDLTGNAEVSFEGYIYKRSTIPNITLNIDNGTEIHLINKSFASSLPLKIGVQNQSYYTYTVQAGGDGFESHAIVYANEKGLVTLQDGKAESDFGYGTYYRQEVSSSSLTAFRYRKIYLEHGVDYDTTVTVYPGQEIGAYHSSANARIIKCIPASDYFENSASANQITLTPGYRAICMTTVDEIDGMFIASDH